MVVGNSLFGAAWTMALSSPKYWYAGLYGGAFLGFFAFHLIYNNSIGRDTEGYAT